MKKVAYYNDSNWDDMVLPEVGTRSIGHIVRDVRPIPNYKAVVDIDTDYTYAIVKDGYKAIHHKEVINVMDGICVDFPEYGTPKKEVWLQNYGGRMKIRYTFPEVQVEIGKLSNSKPDIVLATMEGFCSHDTSLIQKLMVGGFRTICTNGLTIGKLISMYKRKHTESLDLGLAKEIIHKGMSKYSDAQQLWLAYADRMVTTEEIGCFEIIGFNKSEKSLIYNSLVKSGKIIKWDDEKPENRKVDMTSWEMYNVYTDVISHNVHDIVREEKLNNKLTKVFK